jgi:hypothetical protein
VVSWNSREKSNITATLDGCDAWRCFEVYLRHHQAGKLQKHLNHLQIQNTPF